MWVKVVSTNQTVGFQTSILKKWLSYINPIAPGLFWHLNPWGEAQCAPPPTSITQERNMET